MAFKNGFNLVAYTFLSLAWIGVAWLSVNNIEAGTIYTTIATSTTLLLLVASLFQEDSEIGKILKAPFTQDYDVAIGWYFLGAGIPLLLNSIIKFLGGSFNVAQAMIPLAVNDVNNELLQSFSAVETSLDPFWQLFITVFTAGTIEEFAWGYSLMVVFSLIGVFVLKMLNDGQDLSFVSAQNFYTLFAMVLVALTFGGTHTLNNTYSGNMFIIAIMFRLIMNISIYFGGLFLTSTMGYHHMNNFLFFVSQNGWDVTLTAIFSLKGFMLVALYLLMFTYLVRNWTAVKKDVGATIKF